MTKLPKEIREEIIKRYHSRDEDGKRNYTQTELGKE